MTTGIYVRVSSRKQDQASQIPDLTRLATAKTADGESVTWYKDTFTGRTMERPGWKQLERDIRAGKIKTVVVWRLDRLGRTTSGLTTLFDELVARKVNLVSIRDGLDLGTPAGRMMANILASVSQYETEVRAERTMSGQVVARANGKHMGRAAGIHTKIKVTDEKRDIILRLRAENKPVAEIARTVSLSRNTVYGVIREHAPAPA